YQPPEQKKFRRKLKRVKKMRKLSYGHINTRYANAIYILIINRIQLKTKRYLSIIEQAAFTSVQPKKPSYHQSLQWWHQRYSYCQPRWQGKRRMELIPLAARVCPSGYPFRSSPDQAWLTESKASKPAREPPHSPEFPYPVAIGFAPGSL